MPQLRTLAAAAGMLLLCSPAVVAQRAAPSGPQPSGIVLPAPTGRPARPYDEASVLVRFRSAAAPGLRSMARARIGGTRLRAFSIVPGLEHIRLPPGMSVQQALTLLRRLPFVAYAHANPVIRIDQSLPNDPYFAEQWALHNTGQGSGFGVWAPGTADADIDWPEAWNGGAGGGTVVAVIDTGIDDRHSDLAPNVWLNAAEVNGVTGVDDDGNGYVDDSRGWNFVGNDNDPLDGHGHGTHVAGIIAAVANNQNGVAGVMWNGRVMALKVLDDTGYGLLSDAIAALEYAAAKGVRVANASWGYSDIAPDELPAHQALHDAIQAAAAANLLFVAAAGNGSVNSDITPHYPSSLDLDNVVSVAATDNNDELAWFSNWGTLSVDLAAPGQDVFSTYLLFLGVLDDYAWLSGTSMAAPHVSGVAGLLAALPACQTYGQVRDQILRHVRPVGALSGLMATGGLLNARDTLDGSGCAPVIPPLAVITTALPVARSGLGYAAQVIAAGGVPGYSWSLVGGALPPGLAFASDGWISGGPVTAPPAIYAFTVAVLDAAGATATRAMSITVRAYGGCGSCH